MSIKEKILSLRAARRRAVSDYHPELADRTHIYSSMMTADAELAAYVDYARVFECYPWVRKAISVYTESIAALPIEVVGADDEPVVGHPLAELLAFPNPEMSAQHFWSAYTVHLLLGGEAFQEVVPDKRGNPVELWPRRPDYMAVIPNAETPYYPLIAGYSWENPFAGQSGDEASRRIEFGPEEMIYHRFYNPLNPWRGLSLISAVKHGIIIDLYSIAWHKRFFQSGGRPEFALIAPAGITRTDRDEYYSLLARRHSGPESWHQPIVLEQGITDIKAFSWAPKDMEWLEQRKMSREEVGGLFGIPDEVMGWGRDTYENMDKAHLWVWRLTLIPFCRMRDDTLTRFFRRRRPLLKEGERFRTDLTDVPGLEEDKAPKVEIAARLWAMGVPFNQVNETIGLGVGDIPGGDVGFISSSLKPVEQMAEPPQPVPAALAPYASPGPPPEEEEEEEKGEGPPAAAAAGRAGSGAQQKTTAPVPEYGSARHKAVWKSIAALALPFERRMEEALEREFERFEKEALEAAKAVDWEYVPARQGEEEGRREEGPPVAKAWLNLPNLLAALAGAFASLESRLAVAMEPIYTDMGRAAGNMVLSELGLDRPFDISGPAYQAAIREMQIKFAGDVAQSTKDRMAEMVRALLLEADENGWDVEKVTGQMYFRLSLRVKDKIRRWERKRIARTEMHKANELGRLTAAGQSGIRGLQKGWLCSLDGRERETHREAHFQYAEGIGIDDWFQIGGDRMQYPGGGSEPGENINCRCAAYYFIRKEG